MLLAPIHTGPASYVMHMDKISLPEKYLLHAILERAFNDAFFNRQFVIRSEAKNWILLEDKDLNSDPFSFNWCCAHLQINPRELRHKFILMLEPGAKKPKRTQGKFDFLFLTRGIKKEED